MSTGTAHTAVLDYEFYVYFRFTLKTRLSKNVATDIFNINLERINSLYLSVLDTDVYLAAKTRY